MAIKGEGIHRVLTEVGNLRPSGKPTEGICFGFSFAVLLAIFSFKIDMFEKNFNMIEPTSTRPLEKIAPQNIARLADWFEDRLAIIWIIAVAQEAKHFKNNLLDNSPYYDNQNTSIMKLIPFFMHKLPSMHKISMVELNKFSMVATQGLLINFFQRFGKKITDRRLPFGFMIMLPDHTLSCGFDPLAKTWTLSNTAETGFMIRNINHENIANELWLRLKLPHKSFRAIYMIALSHQSIRIQVSAIIRHFLTSDCERVRNYSSEKILSLYLIAKNFNDDKTLDMLDQMQLININEDLMRSAEKIVKQDDVYLYVMRQHLSDAAFFIEYRYANPVTAKNASKLLHLLPVYHKPNIFKQIIAQNVNLNAKAPDGSTPLHIAASKGHHEIVDILVDEYKRDPSRLNILEKNNADETPIDCARKNAYALIVLKLETATRMQMATKPFYLPVYNLFEFLTPNKHQRKNVMK
jgi:hypothetical protein